MASFLVYFLTNGPDFGPTFQPIFPQPFILDEYKQNHPSRNEVMVRAYLSGAYSMVEIGEYFGVHYMTVSRAVRKFEGAS